ncbi:hypothetical protein PIB30_016958 [Stylosanthes scabra]|uniref:Uncharacterized protein n=1 Tax=Stylosanthes scabra TaxID=79078 RepID=A0ABU6Y5R5_9FABA|nr:hypothetical protein [Stylosanthes scabra]
MSLSGRIKGASCWALLKNPFGSLSDTISKCCLLLASEPSDWMMKVTPLSWVYWNPEVKDFTVHNLDPVEMAACNLDHSDTEVKKFLDSLLGVKMKQNKLERLMAILADTAKMAPRAILSTGVSPGFTSATLAAPTSATPAGAFAQVPPPLSGGSNAKKGPSKRERLEVVNVDGGEGVKEDPSADLRQKRWKRVGKDEEIMDRVLGEDAAWEHEVNPIDLAFPKGYSFRKALDAGLTSASVRNPLQSMLPEQLLGEFHRLSCQSLACLQVGLESALAAKTKAEEELLAARDQVVVLKVERDSAMAYLPLQEKVDTLTDQLFVKEGERQSALEWVSQLEEDVKVLRTELKSCRSSLVREQKRDGTAEKKVEDLSSSL